MALNLAIHKATITDDGGTVTATQANMNGIHDEDEATNVLQIATNNTFYLHYDFGAPYQVAQLRIYASIINVAYWVVQCSNNDSDWTTESLGSTGSYVYSNIDDGYRYFRIRCDTTARSAISPREHEIDADETLMKYQCGSSYPIGSPIDSGTWGKDGHNDEGYVFIDTEHPAVADGFLVCMKFYYASVAMTQNTYTRFWIVRSVPTGWKVVDKWQVILTNLYTDKEILFEPRVRFKAGDFLAFKIPLWESAPYYRYFRYVTSSGKSYWYRELPHIATDYNLGEIMLTTDFTEQSNREIRALAAAHFDLDINHGSDKIVVPDSDLTGLPGDSTDPRVVNIDSNIGLNPELDFYPVVSTLAAGIGSGNTSLTLHKASDFPQAAAGAVYGGKLLIGSEKMNYTYIVGTTVNELERGVDGTSPAAHLTWDIVKDITKWVEISIDDSTWKKPGDAGLPLSLGSTIGIGAHKTFYTRANLAYEYQDDKQIYSRIHVLWSV